MALLSWHSAWWTWILTAPVRIYADRRLELWRRRRWFASLRGT